MDEKITLDKDTFKTLSSETRINILKSLSKRRKTLTELSKQFNMSASTIKEHLDNLCTVDLIKQMDDGHKWKYYELTSKGKDIIEPTEKKIWIMLSVSLIGIFTTLYSFLRSVGDPIVMDSRLGEAATQVIDKGVDSGAMNNIPVINYHIIGFVIFSILLGFSIAYIILKKKKII